MSKGAASLTVEGSSSPLLSNASAITDNFTITDTSTSTVPPSSVLDQIAASDITSRANYVYSLFAGLGFVAGCFLLYSFIQTYRAHRRLAWLDCLLWAFCGFQLLLLLLSLHAVAYRPDYLKTSALGCAALSFIINTASLCGLFVLLLMAYVLTLDPPSHSLLRKPGVCAALVILTSVLIALILAAIRGPSEGLQETKNCFMDPAQAGVSYAAAKLCLAFLIPYTLQLGLLICGCVRQWKSKGRFLSGSEEGPVFLTITVLMFFCLLFYSVAQVRGAQLQREVGLSNYQQAFLNVAEFVLFSGSSVSLLLVLLMHRPCRESLQGVFRQLRDCCRSPGRTQSNRNIIAPHIEITDTLQDIES
ncbi:uncharacterized protein LOC118287026 isoform X1 [Scophthalmus maximus]|uniref:G-protein coupled receptors family 3 profile domain-containing protein n=1 Tax=Scophthalmus maximus TaxID=52904 RepID=A0A6A4RZ59_SCOMX|nr:uncharacterized protein LOC118287026 isoform X1 [Scophthalmus maximus]KAF0025305.1 hypothetical protein F2P81_022186 [Scophthalmus maximus]